MGLEHWPCEERLGGGLDLFSPRQRWLQGGDGPYRSPP